MPVIRYLNHICWKLDKNCRYINNGTICDYSSESRTQHYIFPYPTSGEFLSINSIQSMEACYEKKIFELVKLLGVYQSGNTATIYYSYAVTDRPTGDRKVHKVVALYFIKFNSGKWFSPKGFTQGNFLSK